MTPDHLTLNLADNARLSCAVVIWTM